MVIDRLRDPLSDVPVEVQPTLIVGVGGTGTLICQWLYHHLLELFGAIPPFVRIIAFDTDAQEEGAPRKLPEADFFNLFNSLQVGEVIRDFKRAPLLHDHLDWLGDMKLDAAIVTRGCQGLSRLGRVVFFELRDRIIRREVVARFDALNSNALDRQLAAFEPKNQFTLAIGAAPTIHLCASVCGGTGSGLLLDLAYNIRDWANEVFHKPADVVAHLVLPEAFPVDAARIRDKLRAVTLATLEQIEFLTDGRRGDYTVRYRDGVEKKLENLTAPFDFCYLVSGTGPAGGDQRKDLAPMMARMIRAMTVEPASKPIFSDGNNKQLDILSQVDTANQRRLLFASYGLRYGTPGYSREADLVTHWVCRSLTDLGRPAPPAPAEWTGQIEQALKAFELPQLAAQVSPAEPFAWKRRPPESSRWATSSRR
jgi:hypothetical protein